MSSNIIRQIVSRAINLLCESKIVVVLALSREILDRLFLDFRQQCDASDIPYVHPSSKSQIFVNRTCRIRPGNYHFTAFGRDVNLPDDVPETIFASRQGYETLLRRLILDKERYPNIDQIAGTVTGINPDDTHSSRVRSVSIKKEDGTIVSIEGQFFIGRSFLMRSRLLTHVRLHWVCTSAELA